MADQVDEAINVVERAVRDENIPGKAAGFAWFKRCRVLAREVKRLRALTSGDPDARSLAKLSTSNEELRERVEELTARLSSTSAELAIAREDLAQVSAEPERRTASRCFVSKKVIFGSEAEARRSMKRGKGDRLRVYVCPDCHGWHLTSRTGKG